MGERLFLYKNAKNLHACICDIIDSMKNTIITILVLVILGFGYYYFTKKSNTVDAPVVTNTENNANATTTTNVKTPEGKEVVIGKSVEGRDIVAYNYGQGETQRSHRFAHQQREALDGRGASRSKVLPGCLSDGKPETD